MPSGQGAASGQAPETRAVLPRQGEGLRALPAHKGDCLSKQSRCRTAVIGDDYPALRRGLGNMKIQSCPTAAAINLKRLAAAFHARFPASGLIRMREMLVSAVLARWAGRIHQMCAGYA